jgi:ubiquinone/menaquinone biosynthesis C-methylase UbiE
MKQGKGMSADKEKHNVRDEQPRNRINLNPITRLFHDPRRDVEPYVNRGQMAADLGCRSGYYTLPLAELVGPEGKVYAVDLDEKAIQTLKEKADKRGYDNIEAHASSASNLSFIKDGSVDFVLANGLLCSMADHRGLAVNEIRRILKPRGVAYLSLGMPPPFGFVDRAEWEKILGGFIVERRGHGLRVSWAVVSV